MKIVRKEFNGRLVQINEDLWNAREKECLCLNCVHLPPTIEARKKRLQQMEDALCSLPSGIEIKTANTPGKWLIADMLNDQRREEALEILRGQDAYDQMIIALADLQMGVHPIRPNNGECLKATAGWGLCLTAGNSYLMDSCEEFEPLDPAVSQSDKTGGAKPGCF